MADTNDTNATDGVINWKERADPELRTMLRMSPSMNFDSWWKCRLINALMHIPGPISKGVKVRKVKGVGSYFYPVDENGEEASANSSSAILWIHGGGRVIGRDCGAAENATASRLVSMTGVSLLSAEYRLAPTSPFPAALDDIRQAYHWLVDHLQAGSAAGASGEVKIAVAGESAGGGFAAELCQRLLDESLEQKSSVPLPVCQGLIYPMLDDRTCVNEELCKLPAHPVWNNRSNMYGWSSYFGPDHKPGDADIPKYASASRREDLKNLPPAHISVGDLDLFLEEDTDYAQRLKRDGVETDFLEIKGGFHGMFGMGKNEKPVVEMWERLSAFIKKYLLD